jgi:hypothetical protein
LGRQRRTRVAHISSAATPGRKKRETKNPRDKPPRLALEPEPAIAVVREERKCRKERGTCGSGSKSRPYEAPRTFTVIR